MRSWRKYFTHVTLLVIVLPTSSSSNNVLEGDFLIDSIGSDDETDEQSRSKAKTKYKQKKYKNKEEAERAEISRQRKIKSSALQQVQKQVLRMRENRAMIDYSVVVLIKETKGKREGVRFFGFGTMHDQLKKYNMPLSADLLNSQKAKEVDLDILKKKLEAAKAVIKTPTKMPCGPGTSRVVASTSRGSTLAESQQQELDSVHLLSTPHAQQISPDMPIMKKSAKTRRRLIENEQAGKRQKGKQKGKKTKTSIIKGQKKTKEDDVCDKDEHDYIPITQPSSSQEEIRDVVDMASSEDMEAAPVTPVVAAQLLPTVPEVIAEFVREQQSTEMDHEQENTYDPSTIATTLCSDQPIDIDVTVEEGSFILVGDKKCKKDKPYVAQVMKIEHKAHQEPIYWVAFMEATKKKASKVPNRWRWPTLEMDELDKYPIHPSDIIFKLKPPELVSLGATRFEYEFDIPS